ncbi:GNAT family N-acetyltransferase [Spirabiliibacterium falconis]|uniref:GNAT family N-acetyltransferase n=1 Tax=Spirabiliibacterium falconis TaxID=572023 RepID=UPI001AAC85EC|nr:GNAT family N-acetyltransferase [Spirabiliibacterium falconis]MBE2894031.1 N-acetyltransferase [Spirabiliibacterium falconis]
MEILQIHSTHGGAFFIEQDGERIAELTYRKINNDIIDANHTFVSPSLRGQGVADKLYQALLHFVEQKGYRLEASCSYVATKLARRK